MAVTAESVKQPIDTFDWEFAEAQFVRDQPIDRASEQANDERSPEAEVYGRSLSTIHRLGRLAVGRSRAEVISSPEAEQARVEFYTSVEEGFGTDMELGGGLEVRDFDSRAVIDGKVMAKDLITPVSAMTYAGLECAEETARTDQRFLPQLVRSGWDHDNALIVDKMARGETGYNTRIVVSPFPEEAAVKSGDAYWRGIGYVPHLRRGFVQLYYAGEDGVVAGSLSFDGSDKERLREIFRRHGVNIPEAEITDNWLQYAITDTLSEGDAKSLALEIANEAADPAYQKTTNTVDVTNEHRAIMDTVFNESYVHACESFAMRRQTPGVRELVFQLANKAEHFNRRYAQALYGMRANAHKFSDDDMIVIHELLVYSTIEMMRALHKNTSVNPQVHQHNQIDIARLRSIDLESLHRTLSDFGADGASHNRIYSACGLSISPGEESSDGRGGSQTAYGGLRRKELSWHGGKIKKGVCVNCHKHTEVGVANWCRKCIKC